MDKPIRLIIDSMIFGHLAYEYFYERINDLIKKVIVNQHIILVNYEIKNNYEGFYVNRKIPERYAETIKNRFLKFLEDNRVLKRISPSLCNRVKLNVRVPSDDHFYFKAAVAARSRDKFCSILLTEDPSWHKIAASFRKEHKVCIYSSADYLS